MKYFMWLYLTDVSNIRFDDLESQESSDTIHLEFTKIQKKIDYIISR